MQFIAWMMSYVCCGEIYQAEPYCLISATLTICRIGRGKDLLDMIGSPDDTAHEKKLNFLDRGCSLISYRRLVDCLLLSS